MKALSLTQPWATLVVLGEKTIETRRWQPPQKIFKEMFGKRIAIHAALKFPESARIFAHTNPFVKDALNPNGFEFTDQLPLGAIVGTVRFFGSLPTEIIDSDFEFDKKLLEKFLVKELTAKEKSFGDYSQNRYGWFLRDAHLLKTPIECKGALSLWEVPPEIEEQIKP